ncbi:pre-mRNA-splicing factor cwc26 [Striga asiatica]|uniref:Pre-mRNA-splicing factor cwc26 n=1 Tax=Striga asiatica TaxID=4170 RepID=A0A5A7RFE7_STRAF|nr:pre-mRNA-splicing factor cwc26 [Striga asiatica]
MAGTSSASTSLKEYLKKYTTTEDKVKKKKKAKQGAATRVLVVDEDPIWQKPVKPDDEEKDSADEEMPQVDEDIEVKRMRRLEQLRSKRPVGVLSEDGSGWVSVSSIPSTVKAKDQNADISPPRKRRLRNDTPSPTPGQKAGHMSAGSDSSPPRKSSRRYRSPSPYVEPKVMNSDISPLRRARPDSSDLSPPRKLKNERSSSIVRVKKPVHNASSPHVEPKVMDLSPPRRRKESPTSSHHPRTGLVSGRDIKDEIDKTKKDDWLRFSALDPSVSGRDAEPVYRDKKTGKRMSKEEFLESHKKELKKDEKPKEIHLEWGKGLAQKREAEARLEEMADEKNKPFARSRDDPDLDSMLKERVRWGDPMAHLVKKKHVEPIVRDLGDGDEMKESGFIIPQEIPSHSWLRRGIDAAPNRYGIKPGRHWDGVDRSNGYEKEMFKRMNEKRATEREAYLWSVSDM